MDELSAVAHLLRRTSFGPGPGLCEQMTGAGYGSALDQVLDSPPLPRRHIPETGTAVDAFARWWLARMAQPGAGLHEKMTWYWHSHFTTSSEKVDHVALLARQYGTLGRHALGRFDRLVGEITIDPAMLQYLDGDGSTGDAPNENYARELMELFTLGRGSYSETDVREGARALTGWSVNEKHATAHFDESSAYDGDVSFLGERGRLRAMDVARIVCQQSQCAPFVAAKIYRFLVGTEPDPGRRAELAVVFTSSGLDVRVLVSTILRHPDFLTSTWSRPRFPVEWVTAAMAAMGLSDDHLRLEVCTAMGQVPYDPPNVAGWPPGVRWLGPGQALARAALAVQSTAIPDVAGARDPVDAALRRCALFEVSSATRGALTNLARTVGADDQRAALLLAAAITSPEFALA